MAAEDPGRQARGPRVDLAAGRLCTGAGCCGVVLDGFLVGDRGALRQRRGRAFSQLDEAQIGLRVEDSGFDQKRYERLIAMPAAEFCECLELTEVRLRRTSWWKESRSATQPTRASSSRSTASASPWPRGTPRGHGAVGLGKVEGPAPRRSHGR